MAQDLNLTMPMQLRYNLHFRHEKAYGRFMQTVDKALAFESSDIAQFRLCCIQLLESHGWEAVSQAFPNISRRSVYRWRSTYHDSNKRLSSLIPQSTRPHTVREMQIPGKVLGFLKATRKKYPKLSKYKLKPFLDEFCDQHNLPHYSVSWIGKVINRHQLFFEVRKPVKKKRKSKVRNRLRRCPKQQDINLGYLQLDGIIVYFEGVKYCFVSAIELKSRQAWAKRVPSLSSIQTKIFLEAIIQQTNHIYQIHTVQHDNGSEFAGEFEKAVSQLQITQLWSFPNSPKTQGYVERFNWTIQDEFINYQIDVASYDKSLFDRKLEQWLVFYNQIRPHQSLGYLTPDQYLVELIQNDKL